MTATNLRPQEAPNEYRLHKMSFPEKPVELLKNVKALTKMQ